ncbi:sigma-70 family RNA polymerase sigma factor [bacterium]|nr:sigma-70 family RNA polymerase sigma factor [bacterium]
MSRPGVESGGRSAPVQRMSDAELVRLCAENDGRAWRELVERYRRLVYTIPFRMGLDPADADEVFQRTFTALVEKIGSLERPDRVRAWLVTAARRTSLKMRTRARNHDPDALADLPDARELPSEELERLEDETVVRMALSRLGERCRKLLTLLYYRDGGAGPPSYEDIAQRMGAAVGSIGPTRARCLRKLFEEFEALSDG